MNRGEIVESIDLPIPSGPTGAIVRPHYPPARRGPGHHQSLLPREPSGETRFAYGAVGPTPFLVADTKRSSRQP